MSSKKVDQIFLGNTLSAGLGQNFAREAVVLSKMPITVPACVIDNVCGSSLQALMWGCDTIEAGRNDSVFSLGAESITHVPFLIARDKREEGHQEDFIDSLNMDGLFCNMSGKLMGELAESLAQKFEVSRRSQDEFAFASHQKALEATEKGFFEKEITAIDQDNEKGRRLDDCIRKNISLQRLSELPSAFSEGGTVTAGNSSRICDGAAGVLLAGAEFIKENEIVPRARIIQSVSIANEPSQTYESGAVAIKQCLKLAGLSLKEIDLFEICEAFASQMIYTKERLKISSKKINLWGGDIALGHPMGASGLRALVTLMNMLEVKDKTTGLVCVSFGGGGSVAVIIERV